MKQSWICALNVNNIPTARLYILITNPQQICLNRNILITHTRKSTARRIFNHVVYIFPNRLRSLNSEFDFLPFGQKGLKDLEEKQNGQKLNVWHILKTSWRGKFGYEVSITLDWQLGEKKLRLKRILWRFKKQLQNLLYERHRFLDTGGTKSSETRPHRIGLVFKQKPAPLQTGVCWK